MSTTDPSAVIVAIAFAALMVAVTVWVFNTIRIQIARTKLDDEYDYLEAVALDKLANKIGLDKLKFKISEEIHQRKSVREILEQKVINEIINEKGK